jgi:hypothetical protein
MKIYRAVPRSSLVPGQAIGRNPGRRLPGNVPYLVDNIWEFARPLDMPSRRHAVYGSPTPELALDNASADGLARHEYVACLLEFRYVPAMIQLDVTDARIHPDIGKLQKLVNRRLGDWSAAAVDDKLALAPLFLPGVTRTELLSAMVDAPQLRDLVHEAAACATLWSPNANAIDANGELFFEIAEDNAYTLGPV